MSTTLSQYSVPWTCVYACTVHVYRVHTVHWTLHTVQILELSSFHMTEMSERGFHHSWVFILKPPLPNSSYGHSMLAVIAIHLLFHDDFSIAIKKRGAIYCNILYRLFIDFTRYYRYY